jgi:branched-chain amino acid transport system ATP-binding protein
MNTTESPGPTAVLELSEIDAGYGQVQVLRDINLRVEKGSVVALLGANGAGKTTLLKVASGLVRPTVGTVRIRGGDVTHHAPHRRRRNGLCLVPEGRGVFKNLTVGENLRLQSPRRERNAAVERAVTAFPVLGRRLNQRAGSLSGGEQQMLSLARCYLQSCDVLLVDEVSMGLAPIIIDSVFEALDGLRRDGMSLLLVEQYVDRALALADVVYSLDRGSLELLGAPGDLNRDEVMHKYLGG